jgi:hypothetical protein
MKDVYSTEFTRVFDEAYSDLRAAEPDKDVPYWRARAYRMALDYCLEKGLVSDIELGLAFHLTDEFDDFERGFAFLLREGRAKHARKSLWRSMGDVSRYYYVLRVADKIRRGTNPVGYNPEAIERQV